MFYRPYLFSRLLEETSFAVTPMNITQTAETPTESPISRFALQRFDMTTVCTPSHVLKQLFVRGKVDKLGEVQLFALLLVFFYFARKVERLIVFDMLVVSSASPGSGPSSESGMSPRILSTSS